NLMQFFNLVPMMMIYTPSCVVRLCESFSIFNTELGAIGSNFIRGIFTQGNVNNDVDYMFLRAGYTSTAFLWNAADILTSWMLAIILLPVLWMAKFIFSEVEILVKIEERFRKSFVYVLIMLTYLRVTF